MRPGDTVAAGERIALVGSSGISTEAHLHFNVAHNGATVETLDASSDYWVVPPPYQGSVATTVTDFGVTNYDPYTHFPERSSDIDVFPRSTSWAVWYWYRPTHHNAGDAIRIVWYRPDGTEATAYTSTPTATEQSPLYRWFLNRSVWSTALGLWSVATVVNGVEVARGFPGHRRRRSPRDSCRPWRHVPHRWEDDAGRLRVRRTGCGRPQATFSP